MKKTLLFFSLIIVGISFLYVTNSCRKELIPPDGVNEPITFWNPDTNWIRLKEGDTITTVVRLTTDRPIDSFSCMYNVSTKFHVFDPALDPLEEVYTRRFYPDTNNLQVVSEVFQVPNDTTINKTDVVRLVYTMFARGNQQYQKTLRIDIK
jgi:hypothetical protein